MPPDTDTPPVFVTTCTHSAALHALEREWQALWQRLPEATPFQSPHWLLTWWRHFGQGGLWTICFRTSDQQLVGLAPLYVHCRDGLRTVRLIGAGLSDYLDLLVEPAFRTTVLAALVDELKRHGERWDAAEFQQLPRTSALLATNGTFQDETVPAEPCPVLDLRRREAASAHFRSHLQHDERRLARAFGPCAIEMANREAVPTVLADLRRLHGNRWQAKGAMGVLSDDLAWSFHCDAARLLANERLARLYVLRTAHTVAGVYYGFEQGPRAYYYIGGFDPELRRYGIGNQLVAHAIAAAVASGRSEFDFLRGREPYKYRWGANDQPTFNRRLYRNSLLRQGAPDVFQPHLAVASTAA